MSHAPDSPVQGAAPQRSWGKRLRYRLEYALVRSGVWFIPKLPAFLVKLLANATGTLAWAVDGRGRRNGMENLRTAFGSEYTVPQRRRILQSSYRVFARTFLELFWSPRLRNKNWDRYFVIDEKDPDVLAVVKSNHCIYITPHMGGYELLGVAKGLAGLGSMTIAQDFKNPPLTALFQQLRSVDGLQPIIPQQGAMLRLLKHLKKGGSVGALVDLTMKPDKGAAIIRSFGMLRSVSYAHCALAQRTGLPIVLVYIVPAEDGRRAIRFADPVRIGEDDDLQAAAQRCWDTVEPLIRARPQQWLWMYKHWRWLPANTPAESYPEYARPSAAFDAMPGTQNVEPLKAGR